MCVIKNRYWLEKLKAFLGNNPPYDSQPEGMVLWFSERSPLDYKWHLNAQ